MIKFTNTPLIGLRCGQGMTSALALLAALGSLACGKAKDDCSVLREVGDKCPEAAGGENGDPETNGGTGDSGGSGGAKATSNGGSGARAGSGGSDGSAIVYEWGQTGNDGAFDGGQWKVDNAVGVWQSEKAVHPPELSPGDEAILDFDCGGAEHTQLSFVARVLARNAELELFDGETSRGLINVGDWKQFFVNVPSGVHKYRFVARNIGSTKISPAYVLDGFRCKQAEALAGHNGVVSFDDAFVPVEADGWFVDNLRGTHQGEAAIHPPTILPGDEPELTFSCPEHTQLRFVARVLSENAELELFDGKTSRGLIKVGDWTQQVVNVTEEEHTFTFVARNLGTTALVEPYLLDTFECRREDAKTGHNGLVTADGGFVPPEISGEWFVDNMRGAHEGEASTHPPALEPKQEKEMWLDCGARKTELSFVARVLIGNAQLELYDDNESRGLIEVGDWTRKTYDVQSGKYRFVARNLGTTRIAEPYLLDTFQCK